MKYPIGSQIIGMEQLTRSVQNMLNGQYDVNLTAAQTSISVDSYKVKGDETDQTPGYLADKIVSDNALLTINAGALSADTDTGITFDLLLASGQTIYGDANGKAAQTNALTVSDTAVNVNRALNLTSVAATTSGMPSLCLESDTVKTTPVFSNFVVTTDDLDSVFWDASANRFKFGVPQFVSNPNTTAFVDCRRSDLLEIRQQGDVTNLIQFFDGYEGVDDGIQIYSTGDISIGGDGVGIQATSQFDIHTDSILLWPLNTTLDLQLQGLPSATTTETQSLLVSASEQIKLATDAVITRRAKVTATRAQMLTLATTPIELVPAPGDGKVIKINDIVVCPGTTHQYASTGYLTFNYVSSGGALTTVGGVDLWLLAASTPKRLALYSVYSNAQTLCPNQPAKLRATATVSDEAVSSDINYYVDYSIITL